MELTFQNGCGVADQGTNSFTTGTPGGGTFVAMKKILVTVLLFFVVFSLMTGCASERINSGLSFSGYQAFEVSPVSNETGRSFRFDVGAEITRHIISKLRQEGLNVTDTSGKTLVIRSRLTLYETQVAGTADCTVRSTLTDKDTGKLLGEIVATRSVSAGGLPQLGLKPERAVLEMVADEIVAQIEERIKAGK